MNAEIPVENSSGTYSSARVHICIRLYLEIILFDDKKNEIYHPDCELRVRISISIHTF